MFLTVPPHPEHLLVLLMLMVQRPFGFWATMAIAWAADQFFAAGVGLHAKPQPGGGRGLDVEFVTDANGVEPPGSGDGAGGEVGGCGVGVGLRLGHGNYYITVNEEDNPQRNIILVLHSRPPSYTVFPMTKTETTTRSGRQVETTTTVILDRPVVVKDVGAEFYCDSVISNERRYDGEITATYYWAATDGGTKIATQIIRSDFEALTESK